MTDACLRAQGEFVGNLNSTELGVARCTTSAFLAVLTTIRPPNDEVARPFQDRTAGQPMTCTAEGSISKVTLTWPGSR